MARRLASLLLPATVLSHTDCFEDDACSNGLSLIQVSSQRAQTLRGNESNARASPNVMLMIADDFSGEMGHLGSKAVHTPNLDQFAKEAASFPMAYSNHPICAPSRASMLYGIYGWHSGDNWFEHWEDNKVLSHSNALMEHFKIHGYEVYGTGKIFHPGQGSDGREKANQFYTELYGKKGDYGPFPWDEKKNVRVPMDGIPSPADDLGYMTSYGILEQTPKDGWVIGTGQLFDESKGDLTPDEKTAEYAERKLKEFKQNTNQKPWFMVLGFLTSHMPLHVRKKYYEMVKGIRIPSENIKDDAEDMSHFVKWAEFSMLDGEGTDAYPAFQAAGGNSIDTLHHFYLAAKAAVDDCVGRVLKAVKSNGHWDNTIIVVTADHGFHIGTKHWIGKYTPFEEATRVPLMIRDPSLHGSAGARPHIPVSLIDIYPTLLDLTGLPTNTVKNSAGHALDGHSLKPLLMGQTAEWTGPQGAVSFVISDCDIRRYVLSVRTPQSRYIYYSDGNEELYHDMQDQFEDHNVLTDIPNASLSDSRFSAQLRGGGADEHDWKASKSGDWKSSKSGDWKSHNKWTPSKLLQGDNLTTIGNDTVVFSNVTADVTENDDAEVEYSDAEIAKIEVVLKERDELKSVLKGVVTIEKFMTEVKTVESNGVSCKQAKSHKGFKNGEHTDIDVMEAKSGWEVH